MIDALQRKDHWQQKTGSLRTGCLYATTKVLLYAETRLRIFT